MAATIRISSPNLSTLGPSTLGSSSLAVPHVGSRHVGSGHVGDRHIGHGYSRDQQSIVFLRRRLVLGVLLVLVGAIFWTAATWAVNSSIGVDRVSADQSGITPNVYLVQPGDTLWSIAAEVSPGGDVRYTVDRLAELNGGSALTVGQRLALGG